MASVVVFTADDAKPGFSSNYGGGGITIADQAEEEVDQGDNNELLEMAQEAGVATTYSFFSNKLHSKLAKTHHIWLYPSKVENLRNQTWNRRNKTSL